MVISFGSNVFLRSGAGDSEVSEAARACVGTVAFDWAVALAVAPGFSSGAAIPDSEKSEAMITQERRKVFICFSSY